VKIISRNGISASGYQAHTTSPSADRRIRQHAAHVHRIPHPTFVTIAKRPSERDGMIRFYCCFYQGVKSDFGKSEIDPGSGETLTTGRLPPCDHLGDETCSVFKT
jgi:hypothetical protein